MGLGTLRRYHDRNQGTEYVYTPSGVTPRIAGGTPTVATLTPVEHKPEVVVPADKIAEKATVKPKTAKPAPVAPEAVAPETVVPANTTAEPVTNK